MNADPATALQTRLRADLKLAMRERRPGDIASLRSLIAAIDNAQAVPAGELHDKYAVRRFGDAGVEVPRRILSEDELDELIVSEVNDRTAAAQQFRELGQPERVAQLTEEAAVMHRYVSAKR